MSLNNLTEQMRKELASLYSPELAKRMEELAGIKLYSPENKYNHGVTFIIPSINRPTLQRSIDSLLNQTNPHWNAVIVFDGVEPIKFDDSRIKTIQIEKTGEMGANGHSGLVRNHGIKLADTEWVAFLDDDDSLTENYVEDLLTNPDNQNKDFVVYRMKYENGKVLPVNNILCLGNVGISFAYKNKMDVLFRSNKDGEDYEFLLSLIEKTRNYTVSNKITYNVRH